MSLSHHLRADENIRLAIAEFFAYFVLRKSAARSIRIHTHNACIGKERAKLILYLLRAEAAERKVFAPARGADRGHLSAISAVVAGEITFPASPQRRQDI